MVVQSNLSAKLHLKMGKDCLEYVLFIVCLAKKKVVIAIFSVGSQMQVS